MLPHADIANARLKPRTIRSIRMRALSARAVPTPRPRFGRRRSARAAPAFRNL